MADMLSTAVSALQAYRRGLDATSHNIANVGTEGYSRQRIQNGTREAQPYGNGWLGSGVNVTTIERVYDQFVAMQFRSTSSSLERQQSFSALAERVNNLFADSTAGLSATLQKFADSLQGVASAPSSIAARQVMLSEAEALAAQMADYDTRLAGLAEELNQRVTAGVNEVNSFATAIADLNERIVTATGRTGQPPNDLLDQRDLLIDQLSAKVSVNTVAQDDGALNVFIGTGQPLVLGHQASALSAPADLFEASRVQVALRTPAGSVDITGNVTGGELGGLLDFRDEMLDPARNALGQMAVGLADLVNSRQLSGMDLSGRTGTPLFDVGPVGVLPSALNAGSASIDVTRVDTTQLTTADYVLERAGGAWTLRRGDSGATVPTTGSGTAADPLLADGLSIVAGAGSVDGDRYLLRPTREAGLGMRVLYTDPMRLAAALPVIASAAAANTSAARPGNLTVVDPANPALRAAVSITFPTAGTYSVNGGAAVAYAPGTPIAVNGWSLELEGTPAAGDAFAVGNNASGVGDNRNFLALAGALNAPHLDGGTVSLNGAIGRFIAGVGVQTRQAQVSRDALEVVQRDSIAARESVSGVNLDEEAANLIRYQQAYQAAAQVVQVANAAFDSLLGALRR
jgi:flagellar hook-associated protein 1 FlgK